jgi:hypothetical protein
MVKLRDNIKLISTEKFKEYEKNNKDHPEEQISLLVQNIDKFGFTTPVLVDKSNVVIAGHGRLEAGKRLGLEKIPAIVIDDLNQNEIKALRIADNKLAEMGVINWDNLKDEWLEIRDLGAGMEFLTGYEEQDFKFDEVEEPEIDVSSIEEDYEAYVNAEVLKIVLYYDRGDYENVLNKLQNIKEKEGLEDNSQVVEFLINKYENN